MPGIDPKVMEHRLNVGPAHKPVIQEEATYGNREGRGSNCGGAKVVSGKLHLRVPISQVDLECGARQETQLDLENVHGLHRSKEGMPNG